MLLRRICLATFSFFFAVLLLSGCKEGPALEHPREAPTKEAPNIIVILTDDQGWADVGFNGATDIPTPNLDRLAANGVIFTNGYVSHPYCSPSRAGLLTGRFQARFGHDCNMPYDTENDASIGTPLSEIMIPEALKEKGYRTAAIGKWHVGDHPDLHPPAQGFDHWFGFAGGGTNYWGIPENALKKIVRNGKEVEQSELSYITDDFTEETIDFIGQQSPDQPFFIYLAYNAPHAPDHATAKYLARTKHIEYAGRSVYGAMVNAVDDGVGRIDSTLSARGMKDNTLVVFLSDNGGRGQYADNRPNRGFKGMLFEGGIKVPFMMHWPAGLPAGKVYANMITSLDLFPTFLAAAEIDRDVAPLLTGKNLLPYVREDQTTPPHQTMFWRSVGGFEYAVRKGDYKLYKNASKEKTMLFNLAEDAFERHDIAAAEPAKLAELELAYREWDADNIAPGWVDPHIENCQKDEARWRKDRQRSLPPIGK